MKPKKQLCSNQNIKLWKKCYKVVKPTKKKRNQNLDPQNKNNLLSDLAA